MNVASASSTSQTAPDRIDQAGASARAASGADTDTVDSSAGPAVDAGQGFGRILQHSLDAGAATRSAPSGSDAARADPAIPDAKSAIDPTAALTDPLTASGTKAQKDDAANDDAAGVADRIRDTAGTDLAAQLALVSQWAGIPKASTATTAAVDAGSPDALDIRGKLGVVRPGASKPVSLPRDDATADTSIVAAQTSGIALPLAAATGSAVDRDARGSTRSSPVDAKSAFLKALDASGGTRASGPSVASGASSLVAITDAILAGTGTSGMRDAATGDASIGAFATQLLVQAAPEASSRTPLATTAVALSGGLDATVGSPMWSHEVGQATLRMAANDLQTASLRLNPEHLGPLDVQVRIDNGVAHLAFGAAHVETRQAIEASRTTLDQLFADQGLKIGDCAVGDSSRRAFEPGAANADASQGRGSRAAADGGSGGGDGPVEQSITIRRVAVGLVDTFA